MEEENKDELVEDYKIRAGKPYKIIRQEFNEKVFYKIKVTKQNRNGTLMSAYKMVRFQDEPDIPDNTNIILLKFFEDFYFNKTDVRHYNPIFFIVVTDWKAAPLEASELDNALADYNESKNQDLDMPF